MIEVSGYAAMQAKASLIPYTFERRAPEDNDVIIEIEYCGICHTDIHQVNNEWGGSSTYPMVPGHEITGTLLLKIENKETNNETYNDIYNLLIDYMANNPSSLDSFQCIFLTGR
jgi:hypothetical protein